MNLVSQIIRNLAHRYAEGRLLVVGGGGYNPRTVAKCWTIMFATISHALPEEMGKRYDELFDREVRFEDERVLARVEDTVTRIKDVVFPLHGLKA